MRSCNENKKGTSSLHRRQEEEMGKFIDGFLVGAGWGAAGSLVMLVATLGPMIIR